MSILFHLFPVFCDLAAPQSHSEVRYEDARPLAKRRALRTCFIHGNLQGFKLPEVEGQANSDTEVTKIREMKRMKNKRNMYIQFHSASQ